MSENDQHPLKLASTWHLQIQNTSGLMRVASSRKVPFCQVGPGWLRRLRAWPVKYPKWVVVGGCVWINFTALPPHPPLIQKSRMKLHGTQNLRISKHNRQDNLMIKINCDVWSHALATCVEGSRKAIFLSSGTRLSALPASFSLSQFQSIGEAVKPNRRSC